MQITDKKWMNIKRNGATSSIRGFTLVEVLVVAFLLAVMLALAADTLISTRNVSHQEINVAGRMMTANLIMEKLGRDIESSFAFRPSAGAPVLFEGINQELEGGAGDQLTLVRPKLGALVPAELEKVTYRVKEVKKDEKAHQIVVSKRQAVSGSVDQGREVTLGLPDAGVSLALDINYMVRSDQGPSWKPEWKETDRLPDAVKINLKVSDTRVPGVIEMERVIRIRSVSGLAAGIE